MSKYYNTGYVTFPPFLQLVRYPHLPFSQADACPPLFLHRMSAYGSEESFSKEGKKKGFPFPSQVECIFP